MDFVQLISAAGLGAILATIVQSWLADKTATKQRNFQEKKEAYVGFLNAMYKSEIDQSKEASHYCGHWINVCRVVGSKEVCELLKQHIDTSPIDDQVHPDRPEVLKKLYNAMRKDLGIADK